MDDLFNSVKSSKMLKILELEVIIKSNKDRDINSWQLCISVTK